MAWVCLVTSSCSGSPECETDTSGGMETEFHSTEIVPDKPEEARSYEVDLENYLMDTESTAIFRTATGDEFVYHPEKVELRHSPYSTFKVLSTLMALDEKIVTSKDDTMAYDGSTYWYPLWNDELNLEQAFQKSCVWYYHQMVYQITSETIQSHLENADYGNMDVSQWLGSGSNVKADLNGFWLGSSLLISPQEQVEFIQALFESGFGYQEEDIDLLAELMATDTPNLFGKTGGGKGESWYLGYFLVDGAPVYFATFLEGDGVSGAMAKGFITEVMEDWDEITTQVQKEIT